MLSGVNRLSSFLFFLIIFFFCLAVAIRNRRLVLKAFKRFLPSFTEFRSLGKDVSCVYRVLRGCVGLYRFFCFLPDWAVFYGEHRLPLESTKLQVAILFSWGPTFSPTTRTSSPPFSLCSFPPRFSFIFPPFSTVFFFGLHFFLFFRLLYLFLFLPLPFIFSPTPQRLFRSHRTRF